MRPSRRSPRICDATSPTSRSRPGPTRSPTGRASSCAGPYRNPDAGKEPTVQDLLAFGAERMRRDLNDQPELQAEMLTLIGRTYERMGLQAKALPLLEEALAIGRRTFAGDHVRVAQSLNDLGVLHRTVGHLPEAETL